MPAVMDRCDGVARGLLVANRSLSYCLVNSVPEVSDEAVLSESAGLGVSPRPISSARRPLLRVGCIDIAVKTNRQTCIQQVISLKKERE